MDHAITATQKIILGAFGLDGETARAKALAIGNELADGAAPEKKEDIEDGENKDC